jgi:tetratricopeptide (TPR) repeat protein
MTQFIWGMFLQSGQRKRAEGYGNKVKEIAERSGQVYMVLSSMFISATEALMDGRLEEAVAIAREASARGEQELGSAPYSSVTGLSAGFIPLVHLGRIRDVFQHFKSAPYLTSAMCRASVGEDSEVKEILDQWVVDRPGIGSADDEIPAYMDILLLKAAVRVRYCRAAELLLRRFAGTRIQTTGGSFLTCIARHLGAAAALLGRPEEAHKYYAEALKVTTEMRFRPELALTRLQLAELLLENYPEEKEEALRHLDFAINEFREMKMQPSLDRAVKIEDRVSRQKSIPKRTIPAPF